MSTINSTKKRQLTPEQIAKKKEYDKAWKKSPAGIASRRRANRTAGARASVAKYAASAKGKANQKRFFSTQKGRALSAKHCRKNVIKVRLEAIRVYSNGEMRCACCGESNVGFLTLDHVNNDGAAHRKRAAGGSLAWKLRRLGWPKDPPIQVLCYNCNCGRQYNAGICPHKGLVDLESSRKAKPVSTDKSLEVKEYALDLFAESVEALT